MKAYRRYHFIFWQNMPTHHQASYLRALAKREGVTVDVVVEGDIPGWRKECGWTMPNYGKARLTIAPPEEEWRRLIRSDECDQIHVFSGIGSYSLVRQAMPVAMRAGSLIGVMSESGQLVGLAGALRVLRGRLLAAPLQKRVNLVLAIGNHGTHWFRRIGFSKDRLFPWGYFVDGPLGVPRTLELEKPLDGPFRLIYVGQLVRRKRVDLILKALEHSVFENWIFDIVGTGPEDKTLRKIAKRSRISDRVFFRGAMENNDAMALLERADLLVLPSEWDGWGAVVNEALMRGVPVVCTDRCGASDLIATPVCGEVVPAGSVAYLHEALDHRIALGRTPSRDRRTLLEWSRCIAGEVAATYLLNIIESVQGRGERPIAPWTAVSKSAPAAV